MFRKQARSEQSATEQLLSLGDIRITSRRRDLREGLFGQVLLFVFEVLPALHRAGIFPDWDIRSANYGENYRVFPGVFDLAYEVKPCRRRNVSLKRIRDEYCEVLGHDWPWDSQLWSAYFQIPQRVVSIADDLGPLDDVLGVHYRGNDKNQNAWDSNPVTQTELLKIVADCLEANPRFTRIFLATDEYSCVGYLQQNVAVEVINLGRVDFHKAHTPSSELSQKADRAVLDCLALSRCGKVLQSSSALSSFSKILNPGLDIARFVASKQFADIPYFPCAYIPRYQASSDEVAELVTRLMKDDWMDGQGAKPYISPFTSLPRHAG